MNNKNKNNNLIQFSNPIPDYKLNFNPSSDNNEIDSFHEPNQKELKTNKISYCPDYLYTESNENSRLENNSSNRQNYLIDNCKYVKESPSTKNNTNSSDPDLKVIFLDFVFIFKVFQ